ncbi:MAG TPA: VWA domain-containing protein [Vicinamibacterales bacterium]|nr:VWA domain-containing protein [Vicinamibacterales bacterium]
MRRVSCAGAMVTAGFILSIAFVRPSPVVAQNRALKSGVELVPLTVTVTDRAGRYVPDLTVDDFAVFEEGKRQVVSHFAATHVPLDVAFLIDTSNSMGNTLPLAQKAACGLVRQLRSGDRASVSGIGSSVLLHQAMTADLARVDVALRSMHAHGNTALYDAVYIALREYTQERSSASEIRRHVVVLLSDGIDTASHVAFDDLLNLVRRNGVTIYVVSLATDPVLVHAVAGDRTSSESAHALSTLARESGGRLFTPRAAREVPAIYEAIGQELSSQYVIGYVPSAATADGTFRHVSVGVLEPRAGTARTRAGYYADRAGYNLAALAGPVVR